LSEVIILGHPLIQHKITLIRDKNTQMKEFRELVDELSNLIAYEATREIELKEIEIETPLGKTKSKVISGKNIAIVTIRKVIIVDPMLATGGTAVACIDYIKKCGTADIKFMCLIAAPEGINMLQKYHPDVNIYTAAIDERLNSHGYIVPGLGDAGDRLFGTK